MITTLECVPRGHSRVAERQEEVWKVILDHVFADAVHHGMGTLRLVMPEGLFSDGVSLRRQLVKAIPGTGTAVAWLAPGVAASSEADRTYTLMTFPRWVKSRVERKDRAHVPDVTLFFYPWDTWVLGIVMRGCGILRRPYWQDRALFALRARLVTARPTWSAYVLTVTGRPAERRAVRWPGLTSRRAAVRTRRAR